MLISSGMGPSIALSRLPRPLAVLALSAIAVALVSLLPSSAVPGGVVAVDVRAHVLVSLAQNVGAFAIVYSSTFYMFHVRGREQLGRFKYNRLYPSRGFIFKECLRSLRTVMIATGYDAVIALLASQGRLPQLAWGQGWGMACIEQPWVVLLYLALLNIVWEDFHFYCTHRLLHESQWLYRNVHKIHHESFNPDPLSGLSFHWIEAVILFSSIMIVAVIPLPFWAYRGFVLLKIIGPNFTHYSHGDEEKWSFRYVNWHHYNHHSKFNYNFGISPFWDVLGGTMYNPTPEAGDSRAMAAQMQADAAGGKLD